MSSIESITNFGDPVPYSEGEDLKEAICNGICCLSFTAVVVAL
jgi:hypothetical protein